MGINHYSRVVAVLPNLEAIGQTVDQLVFAGFPLGQIFLVGRDRALTAQRRTPERQPAIPGLPQPQEQIKAVQVKELLHQANLETVTSSSTNLKRGILVGNFTGGIAGLLVGLGLLLVPGVGEAALGAIAVYVLSTVGLGTLAGGTVGALVGQGISDRLAKNYVEQVIQGNYLLVISGSDAEIFRAEHILYVRGIQPQSWG